MSIPSRPPGTIRLNALRQELEDTNDAFTGIADVLPQVNLHDLHHRVQAILATGRTVLRAHAKEPGPEVASLLDSLIRGLIAIRVPTRDPDLGITRTLVQLQTAVALALARVVQAKDAAAELGWVAAEPALPYPLDSSVARSEAPDRLARIGAGIDLIARRLDQIEAASTTITNDTIAANVRQQGLVNLYVGAMRVHLDIARMQLIVGERTVDFAALWRTIDALAELTRGFVATIRALAAGIAPALRAATERARSTLRTVFDYVAKAALSVAERRRPADPRIENADRLPAGFSIDEVKRRILADEPVPSSWLPYIRELDFSVDWRGAKEPDRLLRYAIARVVIDMRGTTVLRNAAPLAGLSHLTALNLTGTPISDLSPLVGLSTLQSLNIQGTKVADLTPLSYLVALQSLNVGGTNIGDVACLSGLTALQSLSLWDTNVADLAPLARLTALRSLYLAHTPVTDLAPLSGLTNLHTLDLKFTRVIDLTPVDFLPALQFLDLTGLPRGIEAYLPRRTEIKIRRR